MFAVLVIRRTLTQGCVYGLLSGLGAASADAVYGLIAGLGLSIIMNVLLGLQFWLHLAGGLFLCYLGVRTCTSVAVHNPASAQGRQLFTAYSSVFLLTLTNPITILSFIGIFSGLGLTQTSSASAMTLVLGVFTGSALWWIMLSSLVGLFNKHLNAKSLTWINRLSGLIILAFGANALISLIS
ncbi:threonine/homoserine/homoserine lactone efflux protein [Paenibacillus cellulosilyticus]|uniref:Threonine/homoserine/homoserine lactone efflux protein n=1 Tax=Paenibacillus cellulosilyticus TaxID=375489 RepID=A0A2V2YL02_9BACL|nr:LysE family transporter [Paenibacillus cellulosilyticus]PWV94282.1 threonine/homoserine/homoserine lactone efflux protein [Paenibacillus cellulosilyticus]QKS44234.1 LysE family transporter [Paenibacillus cellulosilyticus]